MLGFKLVHVSGECLDIFHANGVIDACAHAAYQAMPLDVLDAALVRAGHNMDAIKNVKRQRKFIEKHLLNWVGQLHDVAQDYAKTTFYTGMLLVCQGALEQASEALTTVSEELPLLAA